MIFRRLPASSSFVLAAARLRALQLDSARTTARPGQLRGRSNRTVSPARRQHVVTGPGSYALLTMVALMGAAMKDVRITTDHQARPSRRLLRTNRSLRSDRLTTLDGEGINRCADGGHRILDAAGGPAQTGGMGFYGEHVLPRVTDRALRGNEAARLRARVTAGLSGEVLEVGFGFGSGLNMPYYPAAVRRVRAVDPSAVTRAGGGQGGGEHGAGGVHRR